MAGSGRRVFQPGEVLTASNVMNYLQDQSVMTFAGTAARGSAIGTAISEGMVSYLADTNILQMYTGSAWATIADDDGLPIANGGTGMTIPTYLQAVKSSNTTLNGSTPTVLTYQSTTQSNITVTSASRFTIVTSGFYILNARQTVNNTSWGSLVIRVNGSNLGIGQDQPNRSGASSVQITEMVSLTAGQYVEVFALSDGAYPATAGTLTISMLYKL